MIVAGLDPAGTARRPSGVAVLYNTSILFLGIVYRDEEIIEVILRYKPIVVAIDSPLSFSDKYRQVDIAMKKHGYPVLPPGWRSMRILIERSLKIKKQLEKHGIAVIETHPLSALKHSECSFNDLLKKHGLKIHRKLVKDEIDALIAALVAYYYVKGLADNISAPDGVIYLLPRICIG